ncbi:MAG: hypothetical protein AB1461_02155 [Thermodesulfobacteriota bacterium]
MAESKHVVFGRKLGMEISAAGAGEIIDTVRLTEALKSLRNAL